MGSAKLELPFCLVAGSLQELWLAVRTPSADVWDALYDKKENLQLYCHSFITCMVMDTITTAASVVIVTHLFYYTIWAH